MSGSLELTVWVEDEHTVVSLRGDLDTHSAADLRQLLVDLMAEGHDDIVLDLRELSFIDSAGLGVLVGGLRRARAGGGTLALAAPRPGIGRVLAVAGLSTVFPPQPAPSHPSV